MKKSIFTLGPAVGKASPVAPATMRAAVRFLLLCLAIAPFGLTGLTSCKKDSGNPTVKDLPGKAFTLTISEQRDKMGFTWSVDPVTGDTDNGVESIKTLHVTKYNSVTVSSTASVNLRSSNPAALRVKALDETGKRFELSYGGTDADVTLEAWNGEGTGKVSQSLRLRAQWAVEVVGLKFQYGENHRVSKNPYLTEPYPFTEMEDLIAKRYYKVRPVLYAHLPDDEKNAGQRNSRAEVTDFLIGPYLRDTYWNEQAYRHIEDKTEGALMRFVGLDPENASFRTVLSFESEWDVSCNLTSQHTTPWYGLGEDYVYFKKGEYSWPNVYECDKDIADFSGAEMWIGGAANYDMYMVVAKIPVRLRSGESETRYYYLFHDKEDYHETAPHIHWTDLPD